MSKPTERAVVRKPTVEEDRIIKAAAKAVPDAQPLTPEHLRAMVPIRALRRRPTSPSKKRLVSIRSSLEVRGYFKSTDDGWQARIDGMLKENVSQNARRAPSRA